MYGAHQFCVGPVVVFINVFFDYFTIGVDRRQFLLEVFRKFDQRAAFRLLVAFHFAAETLFQPLQIWKKR